MADEDTKKKKIVKKVTKDGKEKEKPTTPKTIKKVPSLKKTPKDKEKDVKESKPSTPKAVVKKVKKDIKEKEPATPKKPKDTKKEKEGTKKIIKDKKAAVSTADKPKKKKVTEVSKVIVEKDIQLEDSSESEKEKEEKEEKEKFEIKVNEDKHTPLEDDSTKEDEKKEEEQQREEEKQQEEEKKEEEEEEDKKEGEEEEEVTLETMKKHLVSLLDGCEDNHTYLLELHQEFCEYLSKKGVILNEQPPRYHLHSYRSNHHGLENGLSLSSDDEEHPLSGSKSDTESELLDRALSTDPMKRITSTPLTVSVDMSQTSTSLLMTSASVGTSSLPSTPTTSADSIDIIRNLSVQEKAALRAKALQRIKNIKERMATI